MSVSHSVHREASASGSGGMHVSGWCTHTHRAPQNTHPSPQTHTHPPDIHPLDTAPPPPPHKGKQGGGTHPTGMLSCVNKCLRCLYDIYLIIIALIMHSVYLMMPHVCMHAINLHIFIFEKVPLTNTRTCLGHATPTWIKKILESKVIRLYVATVTIERSFHT